MSRTSTRSGGTPATGNANSPLPRGLSQRPGLQPRADRRGRGTSSSIRRSSRPRNSPSTLRAARVNVPAKTPISAGKTPAGARLLATVHSPDIAHLIGLTNTPSDNFFAEMLLKGIGARFGTGGTTAAEEALSVRNTMAGTFHMNPRPWTTAAGLSPTITPVRGRSWRCSASWPTTRISWIPWPSRAETREHVEDEMLGTYAVGRCRGKTGTLYDVANLVGFCHARDGRTLAFAFLFNGLSDPDSATTSRRTWPSRWPTSTVEPKRRSMRLRTIIIALVALPRVAHGDGGSRFVRQRIALLKDVHAQGWPDEDVQRRLCRCGDLRQERLHRQHQALDAELAGRSPI